MNTSQKIIGVSLIEPEAYLEYLERVKAYGYQQSIRSLNHLQNNEVDDQQGLAEVQRDLIEVKDASNGSREERCQLEGLTQDASSNNGWVLKPDFHILDMDSLLKPGILKADEGFPLLYDGFLIVAFVETCEYK
ncbi:hypothetical protein JEZ13_07730 [bacterium]|nr:hypothetical protein [bacterium]